MFLFKIILRITYFIIARVLDQRKHSNEDKLSPWHQQTMFTLQDSRLTWCLFILSYLYHVDYSYDYEYIDALMIFMLCYR